MRTAGYIVAAVLAMALLGAAACCAGAAGRNHLSPWWLPAYGAMFLAFGLVALTTAPVLA